MGIFDTTGGPTTAEDIRRLGTKLAFYVFLPGIIFSVFAVFVGLANWAVEGPEFFIWSMVALVASICLFRGARRARGRALLLSGAAILGCCVSVVAFLAWFSYTKDQGMLSWISCVAILGGLGIPIMRTGARILRAEAAEREKEMERNPFAELGSLPEREGDRIG